MLFRWRWLWLGCLGVATLAQADGEILHKRNADLAQPGTFDKGSVGHWNQKRLVDGEAFVIRRNVHGEPWAGCFSISPSDPKISDGLRAELRDLYVASPDEAIQYRFNTYVPAAPVFDGLPRLVLAQWHDRKEDGERAQRPPLSLRVIDGQLKLMVWNDEVWKQQGPNGDGLVIYSQPVGSKPMWLEQVYKVRWSANGNGRVEVWWNGHRVADYRGAIGYGDDSFGPYFKFGVYTTHALARQVDICHSDYQRSRWN